MYPAARRTFLCTNATEDVESLRCFLLFGGCVVSECSLLDSSTLRDATPAPILLIIASTPSLILDMLPRLDIRRLSPARLANTRLSPPVSGSITVLPPGQSMTGFAPEFPNARASGKKGTRLSELSA